MQGIAVRPDLVPDVSDALPGRGPLTGMHSTYQVGDAFEEFIGHARVYRVARRGARRGQCALASQLGSLVANFSLAAAVRLSELARRVCPARMAAAARVL